MHGQSVAMPGRYAGAIDVMQEMGWSWYDLCAAPADLIEEIEVRMGRRAHWQNERAKLDKSRETQRTQHGR